MDKELNIVVIMDSSESAEKLLAAGANKIIDPYEICGRKIHDMLKRPDINDIKQIRYRGAWLCYSR